MKKFYFKQLFTALLLLCSTVVSAHDFEVGGIYYNITNEANKVVAVTYRGDSYNDYNDEYSGAVTIPSSVTYNGKTYSVTSIGISAFECCGITSITIPNSVTSIESSAFEGCGNLTSITIPNSVTSIRDYAFYGCNSLTSITIPNSVISIGNDAFWDCSSLKEVHITDLAAWCNIDFEDYESNPLYYADNLYLNGTLVTDLVIPDGVTEIKDYAFEDCYSLASITIPGSVTNIGNNAFYECSGLTSVTIPSSVTSIGDYAFYNCDDLTSITIPSSVTSIGNYAFYKCSGLTSITIPSSVTSIGNYAFYKCSGLTSVTISDGITSIGKSAFYNCTGLTSVIIPNSVTSIGSSAFNNCRSLLSVTIGNGVTSIGNNAFYECYNLETVYNNSSLEFTLGSTDNGYVAYYANVVMEKNDDIQGDFVFRTKDGAHTLTRYLGSDSIITLPANYKGEEYALGNRVFADCTTLTDVTIPNNIKTISKCAFSGCNSLKNITIPNSVTQIDSAAFNGCVALEEIRIPSSVTTLGDYVFRECSALTSIEIPFSVEALPKGVFYECSSLESVKLSDWKITTIPNSAFYKCLKLKSIEIPSSVTFIESYAFQYCASLSSISIPASVTSIGNWVFTKCNGLQSVIFEDGSTQLHLGDSRYSDGIGGGLFEDLPVKSVYIGRNLSYYAYSTRWCCAPFACYSGYASLEKAIIGPQVTNVPGYLFQDCKYLNTIISYIPASSLPAFNSYGENFTPSDVKLYVPIGEKETYENTKDWNKFGSINEMITIGDFVYSFISQEEGTLSVIEYKGNSTEVQIPEEVNILGQKYTVAEIGNRVFYNKSDISSFKIPDTVYKISEGALDGTAWWNNQPDGVVYAGKVLYKYKGTIPQNTSIVVEEGTKGITVGAFKDQRLGTLTSITIPGSVTSIGDYAFYNCSGLEEVHITDLATWCNIDFGSSYSNPLFYANDLYLNGEKVTNLVIPESVTTIRNYAFSGCDGLTSITIPNSVTSIGSSAFSGCSGLTSVTIGNSVTSIGDYAFAYCYDLTSVTVPGCVTSIENDAFTGCTALKNVRIEDATKNISLGYRNYSTSKYGLFYDCPLETLYLGRNLSYNTGSSYGYSPFYYKRTLKSVTIGNSVSSIGDYAFYDCDSLASIEIPNSVTGIGSSAFSGCDGLTSITIPNSVTSIGSSTFSGCSGLEEVHITDLATWCNIDFGSSYSNPLFYANDLYLNGEKVTNLVIPESVTTIRNYAFSGCDGLTSITIPNSVTSIGSSAFRGCSRLTSVTIGHGVTSIGEDAFYNCDGLTSITIPNSVTSIGEDAFYSCDDLKNVYNFSSLNISVGSTNHGYVAYYADKVVNAPSGGIVGNFVFKIANGSAILCEYLGSADKVVLPADYKGSNYSVGENVFKNNTKLTTVVIPNGVTSIGNNAFYGCTNLRTVKNFSLLNISEGSTTHGYVAYYAYDVEEDMNKGVVGNFIFETINAGTYSKYHQLVEYVEVETDIFQKFDDITLFYDGTYSYSGTTITVEAGEVLSFKWASEYFYDVYGEYRESSFGTIEILKEYDWEIIATGDTDDYLYTFAESGTYVIRFYCYGPGKIYDLKTSAPLEVVLPSDYKGEKYSIADDVFSGCTGLTSITIPNSVTSIGSSAFSGCTGLTSATIPNSVTSIGNNAFSNCGSLVSVTIPNSVTSIGNDTFDYCYSLQEVHITDLAAWCEIDYGNCYSNPLYYAESLYLNGEKVTNLVIPESVTTIRNYAFSGCDGLTSITIPNSVTSIGSSAFRGCSRLTSVTIGHGVTSIGEDAFYGTAWYNNQPNGVVYAGKVLYKYKGTMPTGTSISVNEGTLGIAGGAFKYCSGLTSVTIPNSVTSIGSYAFYYCTGLTSVTIGNGVTSVGSYAFRDCSSLADVTLPNTLKSIGSNAFDDCSSLTAIEIPNSVTSINSEAFWGCSSLTRITSLIPTENLFVIDIDVFDGVDKNTSTLYVPAGAKATYEATSGWSEFTNIVELEAPGINGTCGDNATWSLVDGVLTISGTGAMYDYTTNSSAPWYDYIDEITSVVIESGITSVGDYAFYSYSGLTSIEIPNSVTSIGDNAFFSCSGLTSIEIPNSVTSVGDWAFADCTGLTSIEIPNSVTRIGEHTFVYCDGLTSIVVKEGNTVYDSRNNCNAVIETATNTLVTGCKNTIIPDGITSIGNYAFSGCDGLTSIEIPNSVTSIGDGAFGDCEGLTSIEIPNSVTSIGDRAFAYCDSLTSIVIPNSVTSIGDFAFDDCDGLTSIEIPNSVTSIGDCAFQHCSSLESITISENVTSIGSGAFYYCSSLTSITIPNSVTSIGEYAFNGCSSLTSVTSLIPFENLFAIDSNVFKDVDKNACTLYVPAGAKETYAATSGWNEFTNIVELVNPACGDNATWSLVDGVLTISGTGAMYDYTTDSPAPWDSQKSEITSVVIEDGITSLGNYAFRGCSNLASASIPVSTTRLGMYLFADCPALKGITIPKNVKSVGNCVFENCSGLASITIPNGITTIGYNAFYGCTSLASVTLPKSITTIGTSAFRGCTSLAKITLPDAVTSIGISAFRGCTKLTTITIPAGVTSIGDYAFYGCSGFTSVTSLIAAEKLFAVNGAFIGVDKNRCTLFVPSGAVDTYATIADWSTFTSIEETSFDVKIGTAGYSTLYLGYAVRRPDGVKAYYITQLKNNHAMLEPVWDYIPANTGVILQAEPDTYTFVHTDKKVSAITDNMLRGTTVDTEIPVDANTKYYALGRVDGVVGLYRATTNGGVFFNNANKAYLPLAEAQQSARFTLSFPDGTTTDIETVLGSDSEEVIYDLSGRRINEIKEHGVYIINGKKVVR